MVSKAVQGSRKLFLNARIKAWCRLKGKNPGEIGLRNNYFSSRIENAKILGHVQKALDDIMPAELPSPLKKRLYWSAVEKIGRLAKSRKEFEDAIRLNFGPRIAEHYSRQFKD